MICGEVWVKMGIEFKETTLSSSKENNELSHAHFDGHQTVIV